MHLQKPCAAKGGGVKQGKKGKIGIDLVKKGQRGKSFGTMHKTKSNLKLFLFSHQRAD
jgi:hypothetical protein